MKFQKRFFLTAGIFSSFLIGGAHAGLVINPTWDPSLSANLSAADVTSVQNAFNYAAQQFQNKFNDNIQINITVAAQSGTGILGQSSTNLQFSSFSGVRNALIADKKSADDITAMAAGHFPTTDPTGGGTYLVPFAEAKALGLRTANNSASDGTFTFGAGFSYTYDPLNRAVSGKYDFIGIAEHEISEIMGRIYLLGKNLTGGADYVPFDLFRYTGSGAQSVSSSATGVYFSIDGGATNLKAFSASSDLQDWASGTNDAFNAFSSSGVMNDLSAVDVQVMDVIGYDLVAVPEPANSGTLFAAALAAVGIIHQAGTRRRARPAV